ncbi:MAG: hypothetical protein R3E53_04055 [Myxococcota bacterium]
MQTRVFARARNGLLRSLALAGLLALVAGFAGGVAQADATADWSAGAIGERLERPLRAHDSGAPISQAVALGVEADASAELEVDRDRDAAATGMLPAVDLDRETALVTPPRAVAFEAAPRPTNPSRAPPQD